jgi:xylulokinase
MSELFLGLDCGTQSTKVVAVSADTGRVVASAGSPHSMVEGLPPGHREQSPEGWLLAAEAALERVISELGGDRSRIKGIGVSGQQHGLVVLDTADQVIRPAKLWCDTSTASQCRSLTEALGGEEATLRELGNRFLCGYTAPKLLWLKEHEPQHFRRIRHVLLPHDYLNFWLTGGKRMEHGDASGTALFDVRTRSWNGRVLELISDELEGWLPQLLPPGEPAGTLRQALAAKLGLEAGLLVASGGGDNMMGAIGTGNTRPGIVTVSLGTSGTIYAYAAEPFVDPGGEVAAFCDSTGGWLPLICTMNVTVCSEAMSRLVAKGHVLLTEEAEAAGPGAGGLIFLPFLQGERTPDLPGGKGVLFGLTLENCTPGHAYRAALEGATLGLHYGFERLRRLGLRATEVRLTGGGSRNPLWRQILADVLEVPAVRVANEEGAATGAALQAVWQHRLSRGERVACAEVTDRLVALDQDTRVEPRPAVSAGYRHLAAEWQALVQALGPAFGSGGQGAAS